MLGDLTRLTHISSDVCMQQGGGTKRLCYKNDQKNPVDITRNVTLMVV